VSQLSSADQVDFYQPKSTPRLSREICAQQLGTKDHTFSLTRNGSQYPLSRLWRNFLQRFHSVSKLLSTANGCLPYTQLLRYSSRRRSMPSPSAQIEHSVTIVLELLQIQNRVLLDCLVEPPNDDRPLLVREITPAKLVAVNPYQNFVKVAKFALNFNCALALVPKAGRASEPTEARLSSDFRADLSDKLQRVRRAKKSNGVLRQGQTLIATTGAQPFGGSLLSPRRQQIFSVPPQ
jgi:hypothetical protein